VITVREKYTFAGQFIDEGRAYLEDVSKLLGYASIPFTDKYYAPLFASRNPRLERLLSETLVNSKGN
jgi:hypothetical protein